MKGCKTKNKHFKRALVAAITAFAILATYYVNISYNISGSLKTKLGKDTVLMSKALSTTDLIGANNRVYTGYSMNDRGTHKISMEDGPYDTYCSNFNYHYVSSGSWATYNRQDLGDFRDFTGSSAVHTVGQVDWVLDHIMLLEQSYYSADEMGIFHEVLSKYGGITSAQERNNIISQINSSDVYAINQMLIWGAANGKVEANHFLPIRNNDSAINTIMNAYEVGIESNENYQQFQPSGSITINSSNAKLVRTGVIGPFTISGNGGIYKISATNTIGQHSVKLYKDAECTQPIDNYDNYTGTFYAKSDDFTGNDTCTVTITASYKYLKDSYYWATTSDTENYPQPVITVKRATKTTTATATIIPTASGTYELDIAKKDYTTDEYIPGAKFKISEKVNNTGDTNYYYETMQKSTDANNLFTASQSGFKTIVYQGIDNISAPDVYTIEEKAAPEGYNITGANKVIELYVNKKQVNERTYSVKSIDIKKAGTLIQSIEMGGSVLLDNNLAVTQDNDNYMIKVEATSRHQESPSQHITVTWRDEKEVIPEIHYGKVGLYKYEDVNRNGRYDDGEPALEGAKFKIADSEQNARNGVFVKNARGVDLEVTSRRDGTAMFDNLKLGEATQKDFYIVETYSPEEFNKTDKIIKVTAKENGYDLKDISTLVKVANTRKIYDLALRKFITSVKDGATGEEQKVTDRIPKIDLSKLISGESTTAEYIHTKEPVLVHTTDIVTYTIQIYNEGPEDAYANIIKDDIPEGLEFVQYTEGDGSVNDKYGWKLVDENDNEVKDVSKAKYIVTNYLDIDSNETNLIKGFDANTMTELDSRFVKVQFKITEPQTSDRILTNHAQIAKETDREGNKVKDRDSTPNEWLDEDDEDYEPVKVKYFDLALRKWVTEAIVTENGNTVVYQTGHKAEDDPEEVVKVDLKKSKVNNLKIQFKYSIRITNEGEIAGEAKQIRDDIPEGLKFVQEDNPDWREENGEIVTEKLANTTLQPGESAEVEIILTWINREDNLGLKVNVAEISKDHNAYGTPDIDSTPNNKVAKEDDIDDAPVMLSVKTGSEEIKYITLASVILAIIGSSIIVIKKKVLSL